MVLSNKYKNQATAVKKIITDFETSGQDFVNGKRNTIKTFQLNEATVNVKSFKVPKSFNKVVYKYFRKSKARRSFENASYLLDHNIGTPHPVAYMEEASALFGKSYYVSEHLEVDLLYKDLVENPDYPDREKILRQFVQFTHKLHEAGILFKDHSPGNTLIKKIEEAYHFYLVDLNRMDFKSLTFEERIKNFTRLSPHEEMVATMSDEYAKITGQPYELVFGLMWGMTEKFQQKFYRKIALKKRFLFWR